MAMSQSAKVKMFAFKRALYDISNKLAEYDLDKMRFMLADFLPRQHLEKSRSGFDLLCLMATRSSLLTCDDYSFLEEILKEVGKKDIVKPIFLDSYSNTALSTSPVAMPQHKEDLLQLKRFLGELSDNLTIENVHDMCNFFAGICESINYQNLCCIESGTQLFSRLLESEVIGVGQLQPLQLVFGIIGRLDLSANVEAIGVQIHKPLTVDDGDTRVIQATSNPTKSIAEEEQCDKSGSVVLASYNSSVSNTLPEEEQSDQDGAHGYASYLSPSIVGKIDSENETDYSGSTTYHQLLLKIENQERQIDQQQLVLESLHRELEMNVDSTDKEQQLQLLKIELKEKNKEVKSLWDNVTKLQELLWHKSDVPVYSMAQIPHGLALVIVNGEFDGISILKRRKGALKDADCFSQTFVFLQYKVQVCYNLTASDMRSQVLKVSKIDHSQYDSFVCCVSSHGNKNGIYGSDGLTLHREAFIDPIKSCSSLQGKPKLFFFQACRVPVVSADSPEQDTVDILPSFHCDSDVLIANASTEGNPAYTSLETGSWFANAIQRKLTDPQLVHVRTLQQLLEEVTDMVSHASGQLSNGERVTQCVEVTTRMRKGVIFFTS